MVMGPVQRLQRISRSCEKLTEDGMMETRGDKSAYGSGALERG